MHYTYKTQGTCSREISFDIDGDVITIDSKRTTICGGKRLVAAVGTRDIIIVDTDDVLLVCSKNNTQDVKKVIAQLKEQNRTEFI